jgi:hypothetical protein
VLPLSDRERGGTGFVAERERGATADSPRVFSMAEGDIMDEMPRAFAMGELRASR